MNINFAVIAIKGVFHVGEIRRFIVKFIRYFIQSSYIIDIIDIRRTNNAAAVKITTVSVFI